MPMTSSSNLIHYLRDSGILEPTAMSDLESWKISSGNVDDILQEFENRRLLTSFQCQRLREGGLLTLGSYIIVDWIGNGGMGDVLKCRHRNLGRYDAVKIIRNLSNADQIKRFMREARAAAKLNHRNVVTIHDAGEDKGIHYFAMEYVEGTDLACLLRTKGPLDVSLACNLVQQAARGLQHAHEHGLIHRDIKPANLIVSNFNSSEGPVLKILDFGLARFPAEEDGNLTPTGHWLGTPEYVAPEQARDSASADIRSDIFSLGCVLFAALSGRSPFQGSNSVEKLAARFSDPIPDLRSLRPEIPAEVNAIVQRMLARDPDSRFQTPAQVVASLEPWTQEGASTANALEGVTRGVVVAKESDTILFPTAAPNNGAMAPATKPHQTGEATLNATPNPGLAPPARSRRPQILIGSAFAIVALLIVAAVLLWRTPANQGQAKDNPPVVEPKKKQAGPEDKKEKIEPVIQSVTNSIKMEFVKIPAGKFLMGADREDGMEEFELPRHEVVIAKDFFLGKYEVTQEEYLKVVGQNPSHFSAAGEGSKAIGDRPTNRHPVENVSWDMAQVFCSVLSNQQAEKAAGRVYRLPTEEEWEYACRAGTKGPFHFGASLTSTQANMNGLRPYGGAAQSVNRPHTMPVGSFEPNAFGLYDMHGNVWEWCQDPYMKYSDKIQKVFPDVLKNSNRILRGGSYFFGAVDCRSAKRMFRHPANVESFTGFRVACDIVKVAEKK